MNISITPCSSAALGDWSYLAEPVREPRVWPLVAVCPCWHPEVRKLVHKVLMRWKSSQPLSLTIDFFPFLSIGLYLCSLLPSLLLLSCFVCSSLFLSHRLYFYSARLRAVLWFCNVLEAVSLTETSVTYSAYRYLAFKAVNPSFLFTSHSTWPWSMNTIFPLDSYWFGFWISSYSVKSNNKIVQTYFISNSAW